MAPLRLLVAACILLGAASSARAWTETRVTGMQAHLDVAPDGAALVGLRVEIRVLGGWLSRFDLVGLDPDLELVADKPPWVVSEEGDKRIPEVEVRDGGELRLLFPSRRQAPRRGRHEIGLLYRTRLALSSPSATTRQGSARRAQWTLPAWQVGLQDVGVALVAPAGSALAPPEDLAERAAVMTRSTTRGPFAFHSLSRVQLPRTVAWTIRLDLPAADAAAGTLEAESATASAPLRTPWRPPGAPLAGALALSLLALLKLAARRAKRGLSTRMVIPLKPAARVAAIASCGLIGGLLHADHPSLALLALSSCVALALCRRSERRPNEDTRAPRRATALDLARAQRRRLLEVHGPATWLDATTPTGGALACALWLVIALALRAGGEVEPLLTAGLLCSALLLNGTRLRDPADDEEALLWLSKVQRRLSRAGIAGELWVGGASRPTLAAPRLRLALPATEAGLHAVELCVLCPRWLDRSPPSLAYVARCRAGSPADARLTEALPDAPPKTAGALAERVAFTHHPVRDGRALLAWLAPRGAALPDAA